MGPSAAAEGILRDGVPGLQPERHHEREEQKRIPSRLQQQRRLGLAVRIPAQVGIHNFLPLMLHEFAQLELALGLRSHGTPRWVGDTLWQHH